MDSAGAQHLQQVSNEITETQAVSRQLVANVEARRWDFAVKRALDVAFSAAALIALLPVMTAIALAIRLESRGPVFFSHIRIGRDRRRRNANLRGARERRVKTGFGSEFRLYKFRTMFHDSPRYSVSPSTNEDPRVTRVGRFLRSTSLDELPQFIHVLKGNMSVVGPRPEMPFVVERYELIHRARLAFKPGITGLWQLHGPRDRAIHDAIEWDLTYMDNWSLLLDFKILLKTVVFVFRRRNR